MKILFCNQRQLHPFGVGGDTVSLDLLLKFLSRQGHSCLAIGSSVHPNYIKFDEDHREKCRRLGIKHTTNFALQLLPHPLLVPQFSYFDVYPHYLIRPEFVITEFTMAIKKFHPDLIFTQLDGALEVIRQSRKFGLPILLFIYDVEKLAAYTLKKLTPQDKVTVIFDSYFSQSVFKHLIHHPSYINYQPMDSSLYRPSPSKTSKYITMINPVPQKGGHLLPGIIRSLPSYQFLLVEGWRKFSDLSLRLTGLSNVTLLPRQDTISQVYKQTRLLLTPSIWQESFGRVATEAACMGIPTVSSDRPGLHEAIGSGGIFISHPTSTREWQFAILSLLENPKLYQRLSTAAKNHAAYFSLEKIGRDLEKICIKAISG